MRIQDEREGSNAPVVQPLQGDITNIVFQNVTEMLTQVVTSEVGDIEIARLMIHVHRVEEDILKDIEEFHNKRAKKENHESGQLKTGNRNRSCSQKRSYGTAPSSTSAPSPRNENDCQN
ncbi:hypothetical protein MTR67_044060 [Solanum verrucosum]|uniref:Gag-pol polyprotein n=1 Tax=Solanum verrucosum TaxID=315347 RepID=A0AAF0ZVA2_SOLVR|nr:hypothetical protein MTR67_044060 [Solanum verrucosum]